MRKHDTQHDAADPRWRRDSRATLRNLLSRLALCAFALFSAAGCAAREQSVTAPTAATAGEQPANDCACSEQHRSARQAGELSTGQYSEVLDAESNFAHCDVPSTADIRICAAVQGGAVTGVKVDAPGIDAERANCIAASVLKLSFPHSKQLVEICTRFASPPSNVAAIKRGLLTLRSSSDSKDTKVFLHDLSEPGRRRIPSLPIRIEIPFGKTYRIEAEKPGRPLFVREVQLTEEQSQIELFIP